MVGRAALRQSTVQIVDAWTDPDYGPKHEARLGGVRSMLAVPLVREGAPIGMFTVGRHAVDPFTPQQISLTGSFADQAVIAIENTRLIAELHQRTADLEEALDTRARPAKSCASLTARRPTQHPSSTPFSKRRRVFATPTRGCCGCMTAMCSAPPRCAIFPRPTPPS